MLTQAPTLTDDQIKTFQKNGFLPGGRVLSDEQVEILREELDRVIRDQKADVPQPVFLRNISKTADAFVWQIVNICEASKPFNDLVFTPEITQAAAQLLGAKELRLWHDQVQYKPASTGGVNMWHQDLIYWPILRNQHQVTAWVALDDVDPENGAMSMVPESQKWGNQTKFLHSLKDFDAMPESFDGHKLEVHTCPVRKGYVHFHHGMTWHGSPSNKSGRPRRAIALHYMGEQTCYNAKGQHLMKPFVTVADGEKLQGDRFPLVWKAN